MIRKHKTPRDTYQQLKDAGKLHGTIKRARELRESRNTAQSIVAPETLLERRRALIAGPGLTSAVNWRRISDAHSRKKNWRDSKPCFGKTSLVKIDLGRYSSRCTYTHYEYRIDVECWGRALGSKLYWHFDGKVSVFTAPRGWEWRIDANGVVLRMIGTPEIDFHPNVDNLQTLSVRGMCQTARDNYAIRRKTERENAASIRQQRDLLKRAEREGATVCLRDSLRAGNCSAGTVQWANSAKLDTRKHYRPSEIMGAAKPNDRRVSIVIAVALRRHREEMERGFAILADHFAQ